MLRWGLARALNASRFHAADCVLAHDHALCHHTDVAGPGMMWDVTVMIATAAVWRTGLDEDIHVCCVQAAHTESKRWDKPYEGNS